FGERTAIMEQLIDPWRGPELMVRTLFMPNLRESYQDLARACRGADLLVTHPLAFAGPLLAQKESLRWVSTALSPMTLFSAIDPPLFPAAPWMRWARRLGVAPYRLLFRIPRAMVRRWEQPLREFRTELGLPATNAIAQLEGQHSPRLNLALFSRVLAAPQPDWPANTVACGFPRYDGEPADARVQAELEAFLASGEPPIVFGLGSSAVMVAGDFWRAAIEATLRLGRRAVLLTGSPPEDLGAVPPTVKPFRYLPYSAVFPRALAIVHSGGIGTLAQALAAGRPQLIVPVAFDQPDNARRAVKLGVGRSIPFGKASADALARELSALLAAPDTGPRARVIGEEISREDGAGAACDALEGIFRTEVRQIP
ncbi:MAG: glycosyltransferase, partial [Burkholderiales bacterium]